MKRNIFYLVSSWFSCVQKRMLRWFPTFQVAITCFSCSTHDLNFLVTFSSYLCTCKYNHCHQVKTQLQLINIIIIIVCMFIYVRKACCLILREEHELMMFENVVLREIFVAERNWETVDCRRLHSGELHEQY